MDYCASAGLLNAMIYASVASVDNLCSVGGSALLSPHCICTVPVKVRGLAEPTRSQTIK